MTIRPAGPNHGLRIVRTDVRPEHALIPARWYQVVGTELSTVLANDHGVTVGTVEHVLAALLGGGVDNALIEVDGPEAPTIDGSAGPFVSMIDAVGTIGQDADRWALWIQRPVTVYDGERFAPLMPDLATRITAEIDFPGTAIGHQRFTADVERDFRDRVRRRPHLRSLPAKSTACAPPARSWRAAGRCTTRCWSTAGASSIRRGCAMPTRSRATRCSTAWAIWRWSACRWWGICICLQARPRAQ
ncbi:MAG: UDP-3-O-acyl-N-acetylglucosamine deacetylase [Chromatiales bacterium]|nr:UDP-3-O-acyl-N-acetylglucosamine deacetylase [Chromatiales bacterium]